jgi:hypothetical protein
MNSEPVGITGAVGLVLSTGLTMVALIVPMDPQLQGAILGFGNALIWLGAVIYARAHVTSTASPTLNSGSVVTVITPDGQPNKTTTL